MGTGEGKGEMRESSTKLAQSSPGEAADGMFGFFYFPWSMHKGFYYKEEEGAHVGKRYRSSHRVSTLLGKGIFLSARLMSSWEPQHCAQHSAIPIPITRAASTSSLSPCYRSLISGVPMHILHGIKRKNKVAYPFIVRFRGYGVWGDHGNAASLSYLARCLQTGALSQSNGRCLRCCFLFCEPKDV